jgi:hypothetical protein
MAQGAAGRLVRLMPGIRNPVGNFRTTSGPGFTDRYLSAVRRQVRNETT